MTNNKVDSKKFELLTKWYLRFNGYFTVDNFIIHAADDIQRISGGTISNYTDIDILGIRMPFHTEQTGELKIKNDQRLNCIEKIDIVVAECKTGKQNSLNKVWSNGNTHAIEYLLRFCGILQDKEKLKETASVLLKDLKFENDELRIRSVLFSQKTPSKDWRSRGLTYISCAEIINFLVGVRGECWITNNIGTKSTHDSWDNLIKDIFKVANDQTKSVDKKQRDIYEILK